MLTNKGKYGLKALVHFAGLKPGEIVHVFDIAEANSIPKKFLDQILLSLKNQGLVTSKKGKGGGYQLAQPPSKVTIGNLIRMIEGPLAPLPCASETRFRKCDECPDIKTCGTRIVMREVRDAVAEILDNITLEQVCQKVDHARDSYYSDDSLTYEI